MVLVACWLVVLLGWDCCLLVFIVWWCFIVNSVGMNLVLFIVICFDIYGVCFGLGCLFLDACFVLFVGWFIVCSWFVADCI